MPPNLGPDIVSAAGSNDREALAGKLARCREFVLHAAEIVEGALGFNGEQLIDDAADRLEGQAASGEVDLTGEGHHVRPVADVHDHGLALETNDRLEQRGDKSHYVSGEHRHGNSRVQG
jgi:hypothetical protein